ncbi:hypothetical protein SteCoe_36125 [Stentor coeruleus]|uniref:Mitochondrial carrier protein n=1 Tax=Stentor coeruleus TaxID=5963 RepID=A0A1R2AQT8_9CILI|nr:hypothetical protein SteCoe_36125 [Stentor coeruleus]
MSYDSSLAQSIGSFAAGAFAGACGVSVSQPFDIIKVRMQNTGGGTFSVLSHLIKNEGFLALWKGSGACLFGTCVSHSISFGVVENCKKFLRHGRDEPLSLLEHAFCGFCSGTCTSLISAPTEGVRIKIQTQGYLDYRGDIHYKNTIGVSFALLKLYGIYGLYRGFLTTFLRDAIGDTFYYSTYQAVPKYLLGKEDVNAEKDVLAIILSGGLAGISFWTFTYPIDLIKSRIQSDSISNPKYKGTIDCFVQTLNEEGWRTFTRGYLPCLLRAFPVNIGLFLGFELAMKFVGRDY